MSSIRKKPSPRGGDDASATESVTNSETTAEVGYNTDTNTTSSATNHGKHKEEHDEEGSSLASADEFLAMAMGMGNMTAKDALNGSQGDHEDNEEDRPAFSNNVHMKGGNGNASFFSPPTRTKFFQLAKEVKTPKSKADASVMEHTDDPEPSLMSPELAFKSVHTSKKKKKQRLDRFKKSINTNMVAPSNEILSPAVDETKSPITERKVKVKKGGKPKKTKEVGRAADVSRAEGRGGSKRARGFHPYRDTISCCFTMHLYMSKALNAFYLKQCTTVYPYVYTAIPLAMLCEIFEGGSKVNLVVLLVTLTAISFEQFPTKSIRPFAVIFVLLLLSIFVDLFTLLRASVLLEVKVLTTYVILAKTLLGYQFLQGEKTVTTSKAKKMIWRRFRVLGIATTLPKRIMREVRNRLLGLEWIHFVAIFFYGTLFALSISVFSFNLSNPIEGSPLNISMASFLMGKLITSLVLFLVMMVDTDIVLWLAYFGCLGFCMKYVKEHIRKKKEEYGGWPVAYFFNKTRFKFLVALKVVDFLWGIIGWIIIGSLIGRKFNEMNDELRATVAIAGFVVLLTDVWAPILFRSCVWLLNVHKKLEEESDLGPDDSDDSELDDLGVRTPLNSPTGKKVGKRSGLKVATGSNGEKKTRNKYVESDSEESDNDDSDDENDDDDEERQISPAKALFGKGSPRKGATPKKSSSKSYDDPDNYEDGEYYEATYDLDQPVIEDVVEEYRKAAGYYDEQLEPSIIMDPNCSVEPAEFSDMWRSLSIIGEFTCKVRPNVSYVEENAIDAFGCAHIVDYMRSIGFFVVAAGNQPTSDHSGMRVSKLFGYSEGYAQNAASATPIYYLVELKLSSPQHAHNDQISTVNIVSKCTKREYTSKFVEELNLGCIFEWLHDDDV